MNTGLYFILILVLVALVIIFSIVWRYASRRHAMPCPVWMKGMLDTPFTKGISNRTKKTIERLDLMPGMNVLDAGCGPGRLTIPVADMVGPDGIVTAIDIQEGMLAEAQKRASKAGLTNIHFIQAGLGDGMIEHDRFDRAVMITVLGEIPDREGALREIYGALKPGGILLIEETIRDPHFQTRSTITSMAGAAGFTEKEFIGNRFSYTMTLQK
jgi:ubiquinone/menaquinone biosynthesis C-methylase UbiE